MWSLPPVSKHGWFIAALVLLSCVPTPQRYGRGDEQEFVILYDFSLSRDVEFLRQELEETFYTPREEKLFYLLPITPDGFEDYKDYKNIVILATGTSSTQEIFRQAFGEFRTGMYARRDVFTEGGWVLGIGATKEEALYALLHEEIGRIYSLFLNRVKELLRLKVYFAGHQRRLEKEVWEKYGFTLDFGAGWAYVTESDSFVAFAKHYPDRFFFVFWREGEIPFDAPYVIRLRDTLARAFYHGDYILREKGMLKAWWDEFQGRPALKVFGVWQNDSLVAGGPFQTIAFNAGGRFWMLDMGVFAPEKRRKLEYILRMEIMLESFRFR